MATTREIMAYLEGMLDSFAGVQWTQIGVPESLPAKVGAFITVGGQRSPTKTTGTVVRERRFRATFAYALDGAEQDAEPVLCDLVDELTQTILANPTLGGLVSDTDIDASIADDPRYADRPEEVREYPVVIVTRATAPGRRPVA